MRVADHQRNPFEGGDFLGSALRITSGHNDAGAWIGAMDAADGSTRILVSRRGYGAGVQDNEFGF